MTVTREKAFLLPTEAELDLQLNEATSWQNCLAEFEQKGGSFIRIEDQAPQKSFALLPGDAVYPICSGGFCRSQVLWFLLKPFRESIALFPPHAQRYGFDPYNGKINWHRNTSMEQIYDEFNLWAKEPRIPRFGFDAFDSLKELKAADAEQLNQITQYFSMHYFSPQSQLEGQKGTRRIYLSFDKNTHVVLHRINQASQSLKDVTVVHFPFCDLVTHPLPEWGTFPRSQIAYAKFAEMLRALLDLSALD